MSGLTFEEKRQLLTFLYELKQTQPKVYMYFIYELKQQPKIYEILVHQLKQLDKEMKSRERESICQRLI